jgi:glycosyltransferase involved in cell wall biosynthesis
VSPITDSFVEHPINLNNVRLGYIGRIDVYKKGLDRLVEALARTTHELGSVVHLTMAGPDWYGQLESLLKKCAALDVRRYIEYVGEVARDKLASFFSSVDLLLIPSRYEGFPLVFGEACQYGCPVVVTPGSNVADYVRDNQVGFVVDDLAAELPRIVAGLTPESHEKLREHALTLGRRLSWETISRDICRAYPSRAMR